MHCPCVRCESAAALRRVYATSSIGLELGGATEETGELEQTGDAAGVVIRSRRVDFSRIATWILGAAVGIAMRIVVRSDDQQRTGRRTKSGDDVPVPDLIHENVLYRHRAARGRRTQRRMYCAARSMLRN